MRDTMPAELGDFMADDRHESLVRLLAAPTLPWFAAYAVVASTCYVLLLRRCRERLQLHDLRELIRRPR